jgi:superfamily II DNA or RNA helicase
MLEYYRRSTLRSFEGRLRLQRVPDLVVGPECRRWFADHARFDITALRHASGFERIERTQAAQAAPCHLDGAIATADPTLTCVPRAIPLLDESGLRALVIDLAVRPGSPHKFSFILRQEPREVVPRSVGKRTSPGDAPWPPPPPPPDAEKWSLEERLRWILSPPIDELLKDPTLALPVDPYRYQKVGIKWLMDRKQALLADEMGLGKTMQAIVAARLLFREGRVKHILVVCPKMLMANWVTEIRQWWPSIIDHTKRLEDRVEFYLKLAMDHLIIKVVNYERLARMVLWLERERPTHDLVILDEAQRIKNRESSTARASRALRADRRWALTGTPLENRVEDVVSLFEFVAPGLLTPPTPERVRVGIRPYMLRRRAEEVLADLPEMDDHDSIVELGDRQREAYEEAEQSGVVALNAQGDTVTVQHVFALIRKLVQICNYDVASGESAKLDQLADEIDQIVESGRKALVFSQFVSPPWGLKQVAKELSERCGQGSRVGCVELHGDVPPSERERVIERFRADPRVNVMLLNYRVGGVGLNLQAANYVYLYDRWWNPAVEDQAIKRAHRIGQSSKVFVRRMVTSGTIEERIVQKIREKRRLFSHVIDDNRLAPEDMGLTEEEVFELFRGLTVRPRRRTKCPARMVMGELQPRDWVELVARLYEAQGFRVERRDGPGDQGIDLMAVQERDSASRGLRVAVQCKHVSGPIGPSAIREFIGVLASEATINRGDFVCSSSYSLGARQAAAGQRIRLLDGDEVWRLAKEHNVALVE